jgi:nucleoside diphosphate kinase
MQHLKQQKTLALVKPDGVKRGLIGEVIKRIERRGLKVIALKMVWAGKEHIHSHLPKSEEWVERLGNKTLKTFAEYGIDPATAQGTSDPKEIGKMVKASLIDYLTSGPGTHNWWTKKRSMGKRDATEQKTLPRAQISQRPGAMWNYRPADCRK